MTAQGELPDLPQVPKDPQFGQALAAAFRLRGDEISREEAAELSRALLHLIELGLLVPKATDVD